MGEVKYLSRMPSFMQNFHLPFFYPIEIGFWGITKAFHQRRIIMLFIQKGNTRIAKGKSVVTLV